MQIEHHPAEMAARYGAETPVLDAPLALGDQGRAPQAGGATSRRAAPQAMPRRPCWRRRHDRLRKAQSHALARRLRRCEVAVRTSLVMSAQDRNVTRRAK